MPVRDGATGKYTAMQKQGADRRPLFLRLWVFILLPSISPPVRTLFALFGAKTGAGCYWDRGLNGGTVITVGDGGVKSVRHEYVSCEGL